MEPWPGACGVYHPLLTESVVKFQAETMMETFPAAGPVGRRSSAKRPLRTRARPSVCSGHELSAHRRHDGVSARARADAVGSGPVR
jgi:hypothetical protein